MNEERYKEEVQRVLDEMDRQFRVIAVIQVIGIVLLVIAFALVAWVI